MKTKHLTTAPARSAAEHTPGPWRIGTTVTDYNAVGTDIGSGIKILYDGPDHQWHVATVYGQREENEPLACRHGYQSANARLIAAAPALAAENARLRAAMRELQTFADEIRVWLMSPDLSLGVLGAYQHDAELAISKARAALGVKGEK